MTVLFCFLWLLSHWFLCFICFLGVILWLWLWDRLRDGFGFCFWFNLRLSFRFTVLLWL